jgi:hypothetical protein
VAVASLSYSLCHGLESLTGDWEFRRLPSAGFPVSLNPFRSSVGISPSIPTVLIKMELALAICHVNVKINGSLLGPNRTFVKSRSGSVLYWLRVLWNWRNINAISWSIMSIPYRIHHHLTIWYKSKFCIENASLNKPGNSKNYLSYHVWNFNCDLCFQTSKIPDSSVSKTSRATDVWHHKVRHFGPILR